MEMALRQEKKLIGYGTFLRLKVVDGKLYDYRMKSFLKPDEKGMVIVSIDGKDKKFVEVKLVDYLIRNGKEGKIAAPGTKVKYKKSGKERGWHLRKAIIVTSPDGTEQEFESCTIAAKELGVCRTNIPHVLSGKYKQLKGYKMRVK